MDLDLLISILPLLGIIVIIVLVKSNKKKKALKELEECHGYYLAFKIKEELEKREFNFDEMHKGVRLKFGEMTKYFFDDAYGWLSCSVDGRYDIKIYCGRSELALYREKRQFRWDKASRGNQLYGIKNENVSIFVYVSSKYEPFQDVPEVIKIASEVIKNNGYGQCTLMEGEAAIAE
jgi:hypothetical protein